MSADDNRKVRITVTSVGFPNAGEFTLTVGQLRASWADAREMDQPLADLLEHGSAIIQSYTPEGTLSGNRMELKLEDDA